MCHENPSARPTMAEVMTRYEWMIASLSFKQLRTRLVERKENSATRVWETFRHHVRNRRYSFGSIPPVPSAFLGSRSYL
jgi:hypothetical protein